ncbi:MAG: translation elongation factor-like protein, partial [Euryarchaeota archaeon]|nr:translation elongation factor-like protein [Euryarchaeota archaeon]
MGEEEAVGKIKHYYPKIGVAVVELSSELKVGDR